MNTEPSPSAPSTIHRELHLAFRNAVKLFVSLFITLAIAFLVRFWLPRFLGPDSFGVLHFAEGFAVAFFAFVSLGAETYIRKEVAVHAERATEIFGVLVVFRMLLTLVLLGIMALVLLGMGKASLVYRLVYLFAFGQFFRLINLTLTAFLEANGSINESTVWTTLSKIIWGAGIFFGVLKWEYLEIVAGMFLLTEGVKTPIFYFACKKHLQLRWHVNGANGRRLLRNSFPYFVNYLSHTIAGRIDVLMMSALTVDAEVGWYGAAANISFMALLVMPVISAVVMPLSARMATHGEEEMNAAMRQLIRLVLICTLPFALLIALNAEDLVLILFSTKYLPAAGTLRLLASGMPLVFMSTMLSIQLIQLEKIWTVAGISLFSLALNPLLNAGLIVPLHRMLGPGGAGIAASAATVVTQLTVVVLMMRSLKKAAFDRKTARLLLRFLLLCVLFIALHQMAVPLNGWRGIVEMVLYPLAAVPLGLLPIKELAQRLRLMRM